MKMQLALAQHPMYFIIKEDTGCAERTPPWGASSVADYASRLDRNLDSLERYPECKFGYEWSAYELELLAEEHPAVFAKMKNLVNSGRTAFYNGTYSQPHLQTLSSESCYRQFERGMRVYHELCDSQPSVYAHQEASVHDQVPQLLMAFGIKFAVTPGFSSTFEWLQHGEMAIRWGDGPSFIHGSEFADWKGLDGTTVPLYLSVPNRPGTIENIVAVERISGLLAAPPVLISVPDLIEVDDAWLAERKDVELVLLDTALANRIKKTPPAGSLRLYANWSYIEGIRAEELSRANASAEAALLQAEALGAFGGITTDYTPADLDSLWRTFLACQHHDVYCFCAPELKAKAVEWLREVTIRADAETTRVAEAVLSKIRLPADGNGAVAVFNSLPYAVNDIVEIEVPDLVESLRDSDGTEVPFEGTVTSRGTLIRFMAESAGFGYTSYTCGGTKIAPVTIDAREINEVFEFANPFYAAKIAPDGTFVSLVELESGDELLDTGRYGGNSVAGTDSTGLSPKGTAVGREHLWVPPARGPDLTWTHDGPGTLEQGAASSGYTVSGSFGRQIRAVLEIRMYPSSPRIDITWTFTFDNASIGNFYEDDTKLRVRWPLGYEGAITHDIAFGVIEERSERPFTPAQWTDVSDGKKGLAYMHRGTPKHWVEKGVLSNLFAWGENTEAIGSRLWRHNWMKCFDQRLSGTHRIESAIYPHSGNWAGAEIPRAASVFCRPLKAFLYPSDKSGGDGNAAEASNLPTSLTILTSDDPALLVTSIRAVADGASCRLYRTRAGQVDLRSSMLHVSELHDVFGAPTDTLPAYRIGEAIVKTDFV